MVINTKPKPQKKVKTIEDRIKASMWCKRHGCPKYKCHPHKVSKAKPRKPLQRKSIKLKRTQIRVKPKELRRKFSKSERTLLEKELDRLCSLYVRKRDKRCVTCGSRENLTCSHFVKRAFQILRYDIEFNCHTQCDVCNEVHNSNEQPYEDYIVKIFGEETPRKLRALAKSKTHFSYSIYELREMVAKMCEMVANYG